MSSPTRFLSIRLAGATLAISMLATPAAWAQRAWKIDATHSVIGFSVSHMVVSELEGRFGKFSGLANAASDDFHGAKVEFTAQTASIDTDNEGRDEHLRSDAFFDAAKFPIISFKGMLHKVAGSEYRLQGDLTIKGITRAVTLDVTYKGTVNTGKSLKAGFKLSGSINRQDYGLKWSKTLASGELVVGDAVTISCSLELDKE